MNGERHALLQTTAGLLWSSSWSSKVHRTCHASQPWEQLPREGAGWGNMLLSQEQVLGCPVWMHHPELESSVGTSHGHFMPNTHVSGSGSAQPPAADADASLSRAFKTPSPASLHHSCLSHLDCKLLWGRTMICSGLFPTHMSVCLCGLPPWVLQSQ